MTCQSQTPLPTKNLQTSSPHPTAIGTQYPSAFDYPLNGSKSIYKSCVDQSSQVLDYYLKNIENTTHAFPDYTLIRQQYYASHETSIKTVCSCYLASPPELCFNLKQRTQVKCDSEAKAHQITCIIKTGNKTICKKFYQDMYKLCMMQNK